MTPTPSEAQPMSETRKDAASDAEIQEWVERHDLRVSSATDARAAFEDAQTLHLTRAAPAVDGDAVREALRHCLNDAGWMSLNALSRSLGVDPTTSDIARVLADALLSRSRPEAAPGGETADDVRKSLPHDKEWSRNAYDSFLAAETPRHQSHCVNAGQPLSAFASCCQPRAAETPRGEPVTLRSLWGASPGLRERDATAPRVTEGSEPLRAAAHKVALAFHDWPAYTSAFADNERGTALASLRAALSAEPRGRT